METNLRSYFFDLLSLINGTKDFKEHPSSLVSFTELGPVKGFQCNVQNLLQGYTTQGKLVFSVYLSA
jgi:hypothetical protein